jgi:hypothetical protein
MITMPEDPTLDDIPSMGVRQKAGVYQSKKMEHNEWWKYQAEECMEVDQSLKLHAEKEKASRNKHVSDMNDVTDRSQRSLSERN